MGKLFSQNILELSISRAGMHKRLTLEALPNLLNCIEKQPTVEIV